MTVPEENVRVTELTELERRTLRCVVGHMIPPSREYGVPGAADEAVFTDILGSIGRDLEALREALREITERAGEPLVELPERAQRHLLERFRTERPALAAVIEAVTVRCYYRDDRVMSSIGVEVRPPFPLGYRLEE